MIYPVLIAAAALAVWTLLPRRKRPPYYLEEETRRAIHTECYGDWPHLPRDGSRGYLEKGE